MDTDPDRQQHVVEIFQNKSLKDVFSVYSSTLLLSSVTVGKTGTSKQKNETYNLNYSLLLSVQYNQGVPFSSVVYFVSS